MKRIDLNKVKIAGTTFDKRYKLTKGDKMHINRLYYEVGYTQRELAKLYGVSNQLVNFICHPVIYKMHYEKAKAKGRLRGYYKKDKHTQYTREKRERIKKLIKKGEMKIEGEISQRGIRGNYSKP